VAVASTELLEFDDAAIERLERFAGLIALAVTASEAQARLVSLATRDDLTGLANKRAFRERLELEVRRAARHGRPLSLVIFDIDHFKAINDTHGHPVGDRVLESIADRLRRLARGEELMARIGGEEFAWILPETDARGAHAAATRAVGRVRRRAFAEAGRVTVSAGVCEMDGRTSTAELVEAADRALYAAKAGGRDRVEVADSAS